MAAYYNEFEPYAAQWLRNLIKAGHIAPGDVDERSIVDVRADDLRGYTQCHFFAGIGGWSHALRLAMWNDARPVWTGSCPCQPFSSAGRQEGHSDERHLWPHWARLIRESKPPVIFGEQVAGAIAFGWADEVAHDLEKESYAFASAVLPACGVGAPHKRDRFWFVANSDKTLRETNGVSSGIYQKYDQSWESRKAIPDTSSIGSSGQGEHEQPLHTEEAAPRQAAIIEPGGRSNFWEFEPNVGRVANGISARVGRLCALGNAIVPQVAAEFIKATM